MDEVDVIQNYLLSQAGEHTDVILGLGYDNSLGSKIGITLIATGFEHKDPFVKRDLPKADVKKEEKIVMTLGAQEQKPRPKQAAAADPMAPKLVDEVPVVPEAPMPKLQDAQIDLSLLDQPPAKAAEENAPVQLHLKLKDVKEEGLSAVEKEKKELE